MKLRIKVKSEFLWHFDHPATICAITMGFGFDFEIDRDAEYFPTDNFCFHAFVNSLLVNIG